MKTFIVPIAIVIYAVWQSLELFNSWFISPFERYSWIIFLIWLVPLFYCCLSKKVLIQPVFLWLALAFTFFGVIGSLNAVKYVGLSFAIASFVPFYYISVFWIFGSSSWMPAFGWLGSHFLGDFALFVRFLLVSVTSIWMVAYLWKKNEK